VQIIRSILAVVVGYLVFGASAGALFALSGRDPHAPAALDFMVLSTVHGMFFAALGGFVAALVAGRSPKLHAGVLGGLIASGALLSIISASSTGSVWSQLTAAIFMAPCALLGGWLRTRSSVLTP
jgi:hypothetical protein